MDRAISLVREYRWELLPLLVGLFADHLWLIEPFFTPAPSDPTAISHQPNPYIVFLLASNLAAALVLGAGLLWSLRRQNMPSGLWAMVFVQPVAILVGFMVNTFFNWTGIGVTPFGPGLWSTLAMNALLQLPAVFLMACFAWRLGTLGQRHALLIATAYVAWVYTPFPVPRALPTLALALLGLVLWLAMFGAVAFAFHHYMEWGDRRQRLAVLGLGSLPLVAAALRILPDLVQYLRLEQFNLLTSQGYFNFLVIPLLLEALLLGFTWLLARSRRPARV